LKRTEIKNELVANIFDCADTGAAVLRPYMTVMADGFAVKVTAESLRFAQDDDGLKCGEV
jgi:hypothetical protein